MVCGKQVVFELETEPGSRIFVAGTFNDWNPTSHPLTPNPTSGRYYATLTLPSGWYGYRFIVNGVWQSDPKSPGKMTATGTNSFVVV